MERKGFTLIELLAVIVILSIIALITVLIVLTVVEDSRKGAFKNTAYGIISAAEYAFLNATSDSVVDRLEITYQDREELSNITGISLSYKGTVPIGGNVVVQNDGKVSIAIHDGSYCATKGFETMEVMISEYHEFCYLEGIDPPLPPGTLTYEQVSMAYTGTPQEYIVPSSGYYLIELWGASGGMGRNNNTLVFAGGAGAHTKGIVFLEEGEHLYFYLGGKGQDSPSARVGGNGGYNGGGKGGNDSADDDSAGGGGGATDVRLVSGVWNDVTSLRSRIMVAAGGGGSTWVNGGSAGALSSLLTCQSPGVTQTSGYSFGIGQTGTSGNTTSAFSPSSGAGGGYYGGFSVLVGTGGCQSASGGSSFISGFPGANGILEDGTHSDTPNHYSGKVFSEALMYSGEEQMPSPSGSYIIGNIGNGIAKVENGSHISLSGNAYVEIDQFSPYMDLGATAIDFDGNNITNEIIVTSNVNVNMVGTYQITYSIYDYDFDMVKSITRTVVVKEIKTEFAYTGSFVEYTVERSGVYKIELWGAAGGYGRTNWALTHRGGFGAYTKGFLALNEGDTLYVYVGSRGINAGTPSQFVGGAGGWNGGAKGGNDTNQDSQPEPGGGGGGATDIRLVSGVWNDFNSLKSRIMIAAGGGGGNFSGIGGGGGTTTGLMGFGTKSLATQTTGYAFGSGMIGGNCTDGSGGGGGGYYGGNTGTGCSNGGGGGSSFVSGCLSCNAILESSTQGAITHTGQPNHYSGYVFTDIEMIDGGSVMPNINGGTQTGHNDSGLAKITLMSLNP